MHCVYIPHSPFRISRDIFCDAFFSQCGCCAGCPCGIICGSWCSSLRGWHTSCVHTVGLSDWAAGSSISCPCCSISCRRHCTFICYGFRQGTWIDGWLSCFPWLSCSTKDVVMNSDIFLLPAGPAYITPSLLYYATLPNAYLPGLSLRTVAMACCSSCTTIASSSSSFLFHARSSSAQRRRSCSFCSRTVMYL